MPSKDVVRTLIATEYDSAKLKRTVTRLKEDLDHEARRGQQAEQAAKDATEDFKRLTENRAAIQSDLATTREELALYKYQNEILRAEVARAQDVLRSLEDQRDNARDEAVESRSMARKLDQERRIYSAREEGRHMGFDAGFRRAQEELRTQGYQDFIELEPSQYRDDDDQSTIPVGTFGRGGAGVPTTAGTDDFTERTTPPPRRPRHALDDVSELSMKFKDQPRISYRTANIPAPPEVERSRHPPRRRRSPSPEPTESENITLHITRNVPTSPSARTNVTEHYHLDVPPADAINDAEEHDYHWGPPPRPGMGQRGGVHPQQLHLRDHPPDNFVPVASSDHLPRVPPPNQMGDTAASHWQDPHPAALTRSMSQQTRPQPTTDQGAWYRQVPTPTPGSFEIERPSTAGPSGPPQHATGPSWYQPSIGPDSFDMPPPAGAGWAPPPASGPKGQGLANAAKNTLKGLFRGNSQRKPPLSAIVEASPGGETSLRSVEVPPAVVVPPPPQVSSSSNATPNWHQNMNGGLRRRASDESSLPPSIPPKDGPRAPKPDVYMHDMFPPGRRGANWTGQHDIDVSFFLFFS